MTTKRADGVMEWEGATRDAEIRREVQGSKDTDDVMWPTVGDSSMAQGVREAWFV